MIYEVEVQSKRIAESLTMNKQMNWPKVHMIYEVEVQSKRTAESLTMNKQIDWPNFILYMKLNA